MVTEIMKRKRKNTLKKRHVKTQSERKMNSHAQELTRRPLQISDEIDEDTVNEKVHKKYRDAD